MSARSLSGPEWHSLGRRVYVPEINTFVTSLEDIQQRVVGLMFLLAGIVGGIVLLVATASRSGILMYGTFNAPVSFVVLIFALFTIVAIEGGRLGLVGERGTLQIESARTPARSLLATLALSLMALALLGLLGRALLWAVEESARGLTPRTETFISAGVFLLYAAVRIPIALRWVSGPKLAHAVGIRRAGREPGESQSRYGARTLVGFAFAVLAVDALLVLVNALVAPGDRTIYPHASTLTPFAALLWIVGLAGASWIATTWIQTGVFPRSVRGALAAIALLPAIALDARIPLYPVVAGITSGG